MYYQGNKILEGNKKAGGTTSFSMLVSQSLEEVVRKWNKRFLPTEKLDSLNGNQL